MTTSLVTDLEREMLEKGYVSSRMAAFKLKKDFKSVLRQVSREQFDAVRIGQQQFISIVSIKKHYGKEASAILGLSDWADVFFTNKEGEHVRSSEA